MNCSLQPALNVTSRARGQSSVAKAAYNARTTLFDRRTGDLHSYTPKKGVLYSGIITADGEAPPIRAALWNLAEARETRKNSTVGRELMIPVPNGIPESRRAKVLRQIAQEIADRHHVVVDVNLHDPDKQTRNPHGHLYWTTRRWENGELTTKTREWDDRKRGRATLKYWRQRIADIFNEELALAGMSERVDFRSYAEQGVTKEAGIHLGPKAAAMEKKQAAKLGMDTKRPLSSIIWDLGQRDCLTTARGRKLYGILRRNHEIEQAAQAVERLAEKTRAAIVGRLRATPEMLVEHATEHDCTFDRRGLIALARRMGIDDLDERGLLVTKAMDAALELVDEHGHTTGIFTTSEVRRQERRILRSASNLARQSGHRVDDMILERVTENRTFTQDQREAFTMVGKSDAGLSIVVGDAGAGKSYTASALREAYELSGRRVRGLAPTNAVARDLKKEGFDASTLHSALHYWDKWTRRAIDVEHRRRVAWADRTLSIEAHEEACSWRAEMEQRLIEKGDVLILDEAAMVDNELYERLLAHAERAQAKVILIGDDKQLDSVARGGSFTNLRSTHGETRLTSIFRQRDAGHNEASVAMGQGDYVTALAIYQQEGAIRWLEGSEEQRRHLVSDFVGNTLKAPERSRLAFAGRNVDVDAINADIFAALQHEGHFTGPAYTYATDRGAQHAAVGCRIQLYTNDKPQGLLNGMAGVVVGCCHDSLDVRLDGEEVVRRIDTNAYTGWGLGYCGTVHRGQGKTVDEAYYLHSSMADSRLAYVAMTRHRNSLRMYVDQKLIKNFDALARSCARTRGHGSSLQWDTKHEHHRNKRLVDRLIKRWTRWLGQTSARVAETSLAKLNRGAIAYRIAHIRRDLDKAQQAFEIYASKPFQARIKQERSELEQKFLSEIRKHRRELLPQNKTLEKRDQGGKDVNSPCHVSMQHSRLDEPCISPEEINRAEQIVAQRIANNEIQQLQRDQGNSLSKRAKLERECRNLEQSRLGRLRHSRRLQEIKRHIEALNCELDELRRQENTLRYNEEARIELARKQHDYDELTAEEEHRVVASINTSVRQASTRKPQALRPRQRRSKGFGIN